MSSEHPASDASPKPGTVVAVLNPNTNPSTTTSLVAMARQTFAGLRGVDVRGYTATEGVRLITDDAALATAAEQVLVLARLAQIDTRGRLAGVIIGAFGDPGLDHARNLLSVPTAGLAESSIRTAAVDGRRFGIATTTPNLQNAMMRHVTRLRLEHQFTGFRYTAAPAAELAQRPAALVIALEEAARECVNQDGAECVIIGGGPLTDAAKTLSGQGKIPIVIPITAAATSIKHALTQHSDQEGMA